MSIRESALYPPLGCFGPEVGEPQLREAMSRSNDEPIPRPVALTVTLPGGRGPACEADFERLHREIDGLARGIDRDRGIAELVVDASAVGQPLRLLPLAELVSAIERQFYTGPHTARAILVEAPCAGLALEDLAALRTAGFNRLAIGGDLARPEVLREAGRCGFSSIAMPIECGGPGDLGLAIHRAADAAITLRPSRLEFRPAGEASRLGKLFAEAIRAFVETAGYAFVGPDFYALHDDELAVASRTGRLRFGVYGYTAAAECDVLGAGPGAISAVGACVARNHADLAAWRRAIDAGRLAASTGVLLSREDRIRGAVIQSLLCRRMIPVRDLETEFGLAFRRHFALEIAALARSPGAAHLRDGGDRIEVRSPGWPWLRNMAKCFDLYARERTPRQEAGHVT